MIDEEVVKARAREDSATVRQLFKPSDDATHTAVTQLCNENSLDTSIRKYKDVGYLTHFMQTVTAAKATLVNDLRNGNVEVDDDDEAHLLRVCNVGCREKDNCVHVLTGDDIRKHCIEHEKEILGANGKHWTRLNVCLHAKQTKLRDVCLECFSRVTKKGAREELVVRVHLFYPNNVPCGTIYDHRGRLVTCKQFVPKDARKFQPYHVFHYASRGPKRAPPPECEKMFPFTPKGDEYEGFSLEKNCTALTVESVYVRDASRQQPPFYHEDEEQSRVFVSYLHASELVTDDELVDAFPDGPLDTAAMPAYTDDRDVEKFNVLVRLYLLAHDQGWTATLTDRSPHPLGDPRRPVLFRAVSTEVDVADRRNPQSPALLTQELRPDVEAHITRFCFRCVVSNALRRRVVARSAADPSQPVPVVCYLPFGDRTPAFTDAQIAVLAALYPALDIRRPTSAAEWAALSRRLYQHGVALLDILQAVGTPLCDAAGGEITTDAYVPYTAAMAHAFFLVVANRPLRDYTCVVNQRWVLEDVLGRRCDAATTPAAFTAWVRYWDAMVQLKHALEEQFGTDLVSAHLGQRLPPNARGEHACCFVNGRVTDNEGGLVFPDLGGRRYADAKHVGHLPPGTAVVYLFRSDGEGFRLKYTAAPVKKIAKLAVYEANPEKAAQRRDEASSGRPFTHTETKRGGWSSADAPPTEDDAEVAAAEEAAPVPPPVPSGLLTRRLGGLRSHGYGLAISAGVATLPSGYRPATPEEEKQPPTPPPPPPAADYGDAYDRHPPTRGTARGGSRGRGRGAWAGAQERFNSPPRYDAPRGGGWGRGRGGFNSGGRLSPQARHTDRGSYDHDDAFEDGDDVYHRTAAAATFSRHASRNSRGRASPQRGPHRGGFGGLPGNRNGNVLSWRWHATTHGEENYDGGGGGEFDEGEEEEEGAGWARRRFDGGFNEGGGGGAGGRDDCFFNPNYVSRVTTEAASRGGGKGGGRAKRSGC